DGSFASSNGTLAGGQVVNPPVPTTTTTVVSSSANPSVFGQSVTFAAIVSVPSPGNSMPTGTVQFQIDGTNFGSPVTLSGGDAPSMATSRLSVSGHTIEAVSSGDAKFTTSSGTLIQTVNQDATATDLISSANPSVSGESVIFAATVTAVAPGSGIPSGTV